MTAAAPFRVMSAALVCVLSVVALLGGSFRASSLESVRFGALSLESSDVRGGENDPAVAQPKELCRVPGVRPSGPPKAGDPSGASALLARLLQPNGSIARRFSESRGLQGNSELYVWAPRAKGRAELMVFLN